jgi:hypothetical protein
VRFLNVAKTNATAIVAHIEVKKFTRKAISLIGICVNGCANATHNRWDT